MLLNHNHSQPTYVIGTGVFAKECLQVLEREGVRQVINLEFDLFDSVPLGAQVFLGFNNTVYRKNFFARHDAKQYRWPTYVHDSAVIEELNCLGQGVWIYAFVYVGWNSTVGDFTVMGGRADLGHAVVTGKNNYLGPNVTLTGGITTGDNIFFGAGTVVSNYLTICGDTNFLINSVVHKNVTQPGNYYHNRAVPGNKIIQTR